MSGGGMPELGSKISLISKADIRYEGRLYTVDPQECTIALSSVRSFGTEDRETQFQIAPQSQIYDYILFRGSDIKDIRVVNSNLPHPNDPAIMQVQLPNGQQIMPHFPMNPPPPLTTKHGIANAYGFGGNGGNNTGGSSNNGNNNNNVAGNNLIATATNVTTGNNNVAILHQQQQQQTTNAIPATTAAAAPFIIDMLAGASRSTTPISLTSRKSPSADMGMNAHTTSGGVMNVQHHINNQQQPLQPQPLIPINVGQNNMHANNNNNNANNNNRDGNNVVTGGGGHKRQSQQLQRNNNRHNNNNMNNNNNNNDFYHHNNRDRRDSGRNNNNNNNNGIENNQTDVVGNNQRSNYNANYNNNNNRRNNAQSRGWTMHRGGQNNINTMIHHRGGRGGNNARNNNAGNTGIGGGRIQNQGYRPIGGGNNNNGGTGGGVPGGNQNKPRNAKNTIKFEQDFDFEQANNKFEELRSQLSKLKVGGDEPKNTEQLNGETDKKDDSGNETGAGEHEHEEEEIAVGYDKTKSFFDNISCEAAQDRTKNKKNDWRQERKLNSETFGVSSTRRGGYRGRGQFYNRSVGSFNNGGSSGGGYNRGYRGNNYRNRNTRMGGQQRDGGVAAAAAIAANNVIQLANNANSSTTNTTSTTNNNNSANANGNATAINATSSFALKPQFAAVTATNSGAAGSAAITSVSETPAATASNDCTTVATLPTLPSMGATPKQVESSSASSINTTNSSQQCAPMAVRVTGQ